MNYLKQFGIILLVSFIGELLKCVIPLPVPASIYGIILLFLCLELKIIRVESVRGVSRFLIEIMPVMFIPAAVGLLESWSVVKTEWLPYLTITTVTTVVVMAVSGRVTQGVIRRKRRKEENADE